MMTKINDHQKNCVQGHCTTWPLIVNVTVFCMTEPQEAEQEDPALSLEKACACLPARHLSRWLALLTWGLYK